MPVLSYISCISGYTSHHGKKWDIMWFFRRKVRKPTNLIEEIERVLRLQNAIFEEIYTYLPAPDEFVECMPYRTEEFEPVKQSNN